MAPAHDVTRPAPPLDARTPGLWGGDLAVPIGLGGNTFGRTTDVTDAHRVLDAFAAAGGTLVDTADTYSDGASESIIGHWMRSRKNRDRVLVVTKVGNHQRFEGLSATTVTASVEESLRRLGTDHIDLYLAHYQDDDTPVEESVAAFDGLVRSGKIRAFGLSNFDGPAVGEWLRVADDGGLAAPVALQPHYSLVHRRQFETELAGLAAEAGLAVLPYRALGGGFLSGKYRTEADTEGRARGAGVRPLLTAEGLGLLDVVQTIADEHRVGAASVALAWLLRRPGVVAPLASATSTDQLHELLAAPGVRLTEDELARLEAASDRLR
jgi:aryl-alcohol dehydrogenase-like predicted oxidoreductase